MKALKALVIGMGVVIVVGLALVGYGLYRNTHRLASDGTPVSKVVPRPSEPVVGSAGGSYYSSELPIPAGARLEQMVGAGDRVLLRFAGGDEDRIIVLDPQSGHIDGTIRLIPEHR